MGATNHANSADLTAALHGIIAEGRAKKDEHAASLRKYEINDDEDVPEHLYRRYDEVRTTNVLDAAEFLDYLLTRLAELVRADTATADDLGDPVPGTEYAYPLSDYAYEAARVLREEWTAESGFLGTWGLIHTPNGRTLRLYVDGEARMGELVVTDHDDEFGDVRHVPTTDAPDWTPRTLTELRAWAECIATTIRKHYNV